MVGALFFHLIIICNFTQIKFSHHEKDHPPKFVKTSAAIGGATIIGSQFPGILKAGMSEGTPDIVTISGDDPLASIPQIIESLGGVGRFVKSGDTVGILVNSPWKHPGTYTSPDVALSVANFCLESGA